MAKGNHVFNSFDKVIHAIYRAILELDGRGRALDAVSGSGASVTEAETVLNSRFKTSYGFFKQIQRHEKIAEIHTTQDDRPVIANDGNSKDFGNASANFAAAVMKWATTDAADDPMESWRQLVNAGSDLAAQESYVKQGSSSPGTPGSETLRRKRCVDLSEFVKGELTKLVRNWLLAIRLDLKNAKIVSYDLRDSAAWKGLLNANVFSQ
ncbi:hypothetical protein J8I87_11440 [Paraburkholderia sp. LEh10]|uniref:hypothetical protein n=1 Tax=Paraburkholderia sp. LEh10 TaxID=2821353 RepID=UPI001AEABFA7|nr:hypothetical protein [Paraburkholderia sp. LEh10]MBP0590313.1 hypothetical protein [Paraburkholderia sp. LEh10]